MGVKPQNKANKFIVMLEMQGDENEQLRWLAANVGRLYEANEKLKRDVATLKSRITKLIKKKPTQPTPPQGI